MKITSLGQQGWLISTELTNILVDPVLTETFGTSKELRFSIYPPRSIYLNKMPNISAIVITNEHLDHFHLPSLNRLNKNIPVYCGDLMPECVTDTISKMGFKLVLLKSEKNVIINDLIISLFIGSKTSLFWEKRVYQLYCREQEIDGGIFIQSDALLSERFIELVKSKNFPAPEIFICTNNAQVVPNGMLGAFDNLLPTVEKNAGDGLVGLNLLNEILIQYVNDLPIPKHFIFSGGSYIQEKSPFGPFQFSDYPYLAKLCNKLSLDTTVHGLLPGELLDTTTNTLSFVDWVELDKNKWKNYKKIIPNSKSNVLSKPIFKYTEEKKVIKTRLRIIEKELLFMGKIIMCSSFGVQLLSSNEYINGPTDSKRFLFNFRTYNNKQSYQYVLDLCNANFVNIDSLPIDKAIRKYAYGIDIFLEDFLALLDGRIQIWELATANTRQWYLGDKINSPVAFLYRYFSEQVRQDLAIKVYENLYAQ